MYRLHRYYFYVTAFVLPVILFSSCGTTKKATTATAPFKLPADYKAPAGEEHNEFTSYFYDAVKEKMTGNYDKAINLFSQCLAIDPYNAAANYQMGDIYEYYKEPDTAIIYARRAAQLDTANVWYQDLYAHCLQDKGMYTEMATVYEKLIKAHPDVTDYYYKLAAAQIEANEPEKAADTYSRLEQKEGGFDEDITEEKIKIYEAVKNYPKAETEVQRLIQHDSTSMKYYDMLGDIYEMEGKSDKAFSLYKKMESLHPEDPAIHLSLASYYRAHHNDTASFNELLMAFEQPSLDIATELHVLSSMNDVSNGHDTLHRQAIQLCRAMVKGHPADFRAHAMYADFLYQQHSLMEAYEQYNKALSEDSSKFTLWTQLMVIDYEIGNYDDLLKLSEGAMNFFPDEPLSYYFNGIANQQKKQYGNAAASLNKGIEYVINNKNLLNQFYSALGDIYNYAGRYAASDSAYDEALKLNPNDDNVLNNYSYYLSVRDTNLAKAELMSKKANELSANNYTYEDTYAWILYVEGKYADAKEWEDKSLANGGDKDGTILEHYGDIIFKLGDKDKAVEYWQKAKDNGAKSELLDRKIRDKQLYTR